MGLKIDEHRQGQNTYDRASEGFVKSPKEKGKEARYGYHIDKKSAETALQTQEENVMRGPTIRYPDPGESSHREKHQRVWT